MYAVVWADNKALRAMLPTKREAAAYCSNQNSPHLFEVVEIGSANR